MNWKYIVHFLNKNSLILLVLVSCGVCYQVSYYNIPEIDHFCRIKLLFLLDNFKYYPLLRLLYVKHFLCVRPTRGTGSRRNCSGVSSRVLETWEIPCSSYALLEIGVFFYENHWVNVCILTEEMCTHT